MSKEKRMAGSYEIEQSIYIGEKEVLFGVNKAEEYPFMVCYCSYNNPLSAPWCTEAIGTDDYLEAMQVFTDRVQAQIELVKRSRNNTALIKHRLLFPTVFPIITARISSARWWLSTPSRNDMNISTLPISLYWQTVDTVQQAAEGRRCLALALPQVSVADGKDMMCLGKSSQKKCQSGQRKLSQN